MSKHTARREGRFTFNKRTFPIGTYWMPYGERSRPGSYRDAPTRGQKVAGVGGSKAGKGKKS